MSQERSEARRGRWLDSAGATIGVALLTLTGVAATFLATSSPHTPDAFTGHVYALGLPLLRRVYVTDVQHDLLAIGFWSGLAALFVGRVLSGAIRGARR